MSQKDLSRRDFLKTSSVFWFGQLLLNDPVVKLLTHNSTQPTDYNFCYSLVRATDLLQLKFYFYNAALHGHRVKPNSSLPIFVYVQLPPQHIAEQLITDDKYKTFIKSQFSRQLSFLGTLPSIGFKYIGKKTLKLFPEELLNWSENFQMLTIDDFVPVNDSHAPAITPYQPTLTTLINEFKNQAFDNIPVRHDFNGNKLPLTTIDITYKMRLSPIAEPYGKYNNDVDARKKGEHVFEWSNDLVNYYHYKKRKDEDITIVAPWENSLAFMDVSQNKLLLPRFKVVQVACFDDAQKPNSDYGIPLLPAPVERMDLQGLTMQPSIDRDVISVKKFKVSVLGGTVNLKYRNGDPGSNHTLVAWEQNSKYGRDNLQSVTFRAIEYFTGLKMEVSILAPRTFQAGVSFLPELYSVKFAEDVKNYTEPSMVSRLPYKSITPDPKTINQAFLFQPEPLPATNGKPQTSAAIMVAKGQVLDGTGKLIGSQLFDFSYIGTDKSGKQISFTSKMILIPADEYVMATGSFRGYGPRQKIDIKDIGYLNPACDKSFQGYPPEGCDAGTDTYTYSTVKTFSQANQVPLSDLLTQIRAHVGSYRGIYGHALNQQLTFAKLDFLKRQGVVRKDSRTTTFKTKDILLGSYPNPDMYPPPVPDFYSVEFPILPALEITAVIIPQIDQIQGVSKYHDVIFTTEYLNSQYEIDDNAQATKGNKARLFFQLSAPIGNFFSDHYRSSGAMVNPGITISHVSAMDNSIAYNEQHNQPTTATHNNDGGSAITVSATPASSIFREIKAQILGMSVLDLLNDILPVDDLPSFAFVQQAQQGIEQVSTLASEYQTYAQQWVTDYNNLSGQVSQLQTTVSGYQKTLKNLSKNDLRNWLDTILAQSGLANSYQSKATALQTNLATYQKYVTNTLTPFYTHLTGIGGVHGPFASISTNLDALLATPTLDNLVPVLDLVYTNNGQVNEQLFKEAAKAYYANLLVNATHSPKFLTAVTQVNTLKTQVEVQYTGFYNALVQAMQEASDFCADYLNNVLTTVQAKVKDSLDSIPNYIISLLGDTMKATDFGDWVVIINQLAQMYGYYYDLYTSLQQEYYSQLAIANNIVNDVSDISTLTSALVKQFGTDLIAIKLGDSVTGAPKDNFTALQSKLNDLVNNGSVILSDYRDYNSSEIQAAAQTATQTINNVLTELYNDYDQVIAEMITAQATLDDKEDQLRDFMESELDSLNNQLVTGQAKLLVAAKGTQAYQNAVTTVNELNGFIAAIQALSHQTLNYTFSTTNFRNASLGGIIDFVPEPGVTTLSLNVTYTAQLNIASLNNPPAVTSQSFKTDTSLSNFKIGLLGLLYIDFEEVDFVAGSDVKDQFTVRIRKVDFGGCLGFMQVFEDFLKSLSDDLSFDISALGATVSYALNIPDFTTGYFNFFGLSLSSSLLLPFDPDGAMQISFGIGSAINKFGLTLMGIFGGQGYFQINADPKRGVTGMDIALEFGAIFHLEIADILDGTAYLVGGIYIRNYDGAFDLRAYILCVGRVSVLGLISASVSFYLGLEGNSQVIAGECTISISISIGPFFSISVSATMYKEIEGTRSTDSGAAAAPVATPLKAAGEAEVLNENISQGTYYTGEMAHMVVRTPASDSEAPAATINGNGQNRPFTGETVHKGKQKLTYLTFDTSEMPAGDYQVQLSYKGQNHSHMVQVIDEDSASQLMANADKDMTGAYQYYASYYQS